MAKFDLEAARAAQERSFAVKALWESRGLDLGPVRAIPARAFTVPGRDRLHFNDVRCSVTPDHRFEEPGRSRDIWNDAVCYWCCDLWFAFQELYLWRGIWTESRMQELRQIFRLLNTPPPAQGTFFKSLPTVLPPLPDSVSDDDVVALAHLLQRVMYGVENCTEDGLLLGDAEMRSRLRELLAPRRDEVVAHARLLGRFSVSDLQYARWVGGLHPFLSEADCRRGADMVRSGGDPVAFAEDTLVCHSKDVEDAVAAGVEPLPPPEGSPLDKDLTWATNCLAAAKVAHFFTVPPTVFPADSLKIWDWRNFTPCSAQHPVT